MTLAKEINSAYDRIKSHVLLTPLIKSAFLSELSQGEVYLKLESEQYTGSFKARGALSKILSLSENERSRGLLAASTGNHAQGFARACEISNSKGVIYLPLNADPSKIEALKYYDVDLRFHGNNSLETELFAKSEAERLNMVWISPYNDFEVIAGQGTIGREITDQLEEIDAVLGCIGGGGMMSGVGAWFQANSPKTRIVGCLPENSAEMYLSVKKGEVVVLEDMKETLSDGSAGGLEVGAITFELCREIIQDYVLVSEDEIARGIKFMAEKHHKIVEGSAGVAISSLVKNPQDFKDQRVVIIVCGANISTEKLKKIL